MLGTKDKVLLGISTVVGVITAIWAGGPGKMYGGCGGSEVVILSTAAQIFITVVKFVFTVLGSGAAAYVLGLCVTGAYSKLADPKPPSPLLASGYRAKLGYFKFIRFCTNGLPAVGTVVLLASTVVFGVVAISATLKSKLYCPVDNDATAVMSLLAGLCAAAAAGVIVYHLLVKFGYNDGAGPYRWGAGKIESMLPSMIQYTPLWATMRALYDGANEYFIILDCPIAPGESAILAGGEQKIVMITGDSIRVTSSAATSVDAILSIMEIT